MFYGLNGAGGEICHKFRTCSNICVDFPAIPDVCYDDDLVHEDVFEEEDP